MDIQWLKKNTIGYHTMISNDKNTTVLTKIDEDFELLTSLELINKLKISNSTLRRFLKKKDFPRLMVGVDYRFILREVIDYIRVKVEPDSDFKDKK